MIESNTPPGPSPICDIIVLTFNHLDVTKAFVDSVVRCTTLPVRVIFVDNRSIDRTRDYLASLQSAGNVQFEVILSAENEGFIRGNNKGLKNTSAPFVCFSNNDVLLTPGWLEEMLEVFSRHPRLGVLNPNSNNLGVDVPAGTELDAFAREWRAKHSGQMAEMALGVGFFMLVRREVIERIGGFCEDYAPMFFEDRDYFLRAIRAGFLTGVAKGAYVWHMEHASMKQLGPQRQKIFDRSKAVFEANWGKTLRVAWILNGESSLDEILEQAAQVARTGNYVSLYIREGSNVQREGESPGRRGISGMTFLRYHGRADLYWKLMFKKKKFDLVIYKGKMLPRLLHWTGQPAVARFDPAIVQQLKFSGKAR